MATYSCYVLGCRDDSVVGRRHKQYGFVDACAGHDPDRYGVARSFFPEPAFCPDAQGPAAPDTASVPPDPNALIVDVLRNALQLLLGPTGPQEPDGGTKAKLRRPVPVIPPSGATARPF